MRLLQCLKIMVLLKLVVYLAMIYHVFIPRINQAGSVLNLAQLVLETENFVMDYLGTRTFKKVTLMYQVLPILLNSANVYLSQKLITFLIWKIKLLFNRIPICEIWC